MFAQLDIVISKFVPENIQNFQTSVAVMLDHFVYLLKAERTACVVGFILTRTQQGSQKTYQIGRMEFMGSVHQMIYIGVVEIASIFQEGYGGVSSACILIFSNGFRSIEARDEVDDCFPLNIDVF